LHKKISKQIELFANKLTSYNWRKKINLIGKLSWGGISGDQKSYALGGWKNNQEIESLISRGSKVLQFYPSFSGDLKSIKHSNQLSISW